MDPEDLIDDTLLDACDCPASSTSWWKVLLLFWVLW